MPPPERLIPLHRLDTIREECLLKLRTKPMHELKKTEFSERLQNISYEGETDMKGRVGARKLLRRIRNEIEAASNTVDCTLAIQGLTRAVKHHTQLSVAPEQTKEWEGQKLAFQRRRTDIGDKGNTEGYRLLVIALRDDTSRATVLLKIDQRVARITKMLGFEWPEFYLQQQQQAVYQSIVYDRKATDLDDLEDVLKKLKCREESNLVALPRFPKQLIEDLLGDIGKMPAYERKDSPESHSHNQAAVKAQQRMEKWPSATGSFHSNHCKHLTRVLMGRRRRAFSLTPKDSRLDIRLQVLFNS